MNSNSTRPCAGINWETNEALIVSVDFCDNDVFLDLTTSSDVIGTLALVCELREFEASYASCSSRDFSCHASLKRVYVSREFDIFIGGMRGLH